jgi:hypothetical protein
MNWIDKHTYTGLCHKEQRYGNENYLFLFMKLLFFPTKLRKLTN